MGYMGHWPILRAHHHFGQGLSLFLFTKLYLFCGLFWYGCVSQYFQTNPNPNHIQKYPFIYLISQKVDPFINSPPPPPPPSKFYKKANSGAHILFRCTKLRKWEPVYPLFQSQWELCYNMKLKYNLLIKASHYDPDPN